MEILISYHKYVDMSISGQIALLMNPPPPPVIKAYEKLCLLPDLLACHAYVHIIQIMHVVRFTHTHSPAQAQFYFLDQELYLVFS